MIGKDWWSGINLDDIQDLNLCMVSDSFHYYKGKVVKKYMVNITGVECSPSLHRMLFLGLAFSFN